ncbi:MAG: hypothetical protein HC809_01945 [Gammaproteobacteria bacterium]|nr:hypothetical protein [Gammaproteobacteria bacterium]
MRQALYDEGAVLMADVLVNLHGDAHRARRITESKVFRRDYFRYYEQEVFPTTLAQTLAPFLDSGRLDLVDFGYRVMANLTVDFAGIDRPERTPRRRPRWSICCVRWAWRRHYFMPRVTGRPSVPRCAKG